MEVSETDLFRLATATYRRYQHKHPRPTEDKQLLRELALATNDPVIQQFCLRINGKLAFHTLSSGMTVFIIRCKGWQSHAFTNAAALSTLAKGLLEGYLLPATLGGVYLNKHNL